MEIRPASGADDVRTCLEIFVQAIDALESKEGKPPIDPKEVGWLPVSLDHLAATDPDGLVLAVEGAEPVAFGCAFRRERFWFLSYLFVLPDAQNAGVGRAILEHLLPPEAERASMDLATVVESRQPASTMLYARYGLVPRTPLYWLTHLPALDGLPPLPKTVTARAPNLEADATAIDRLDRVVLGYARPEDHRMWVRDAKTARVYVDDIGSLVGYGYHAPDDWLSPVAAGDETLSAGIVRNLFEAHEGDPGKVTVQIAGTSSLLLPLLLRAGMRADQGAQMIYCSNGRLPEAGYLPFAGYHP